MITRNAERIAEASVGYKDDVLDTRKHWWNYRDDDVGSTDVKPSSTTTEAPSTPQTTPKFGLLRITREAPVASEEYRVREFGRIERRFSLTPDDSNSWSDWKDMRDTELLWLNKTHPQVHDWLWKTRGNGEQTAMWIGAFQQRTLGKWNEIRAKEAKEDKTES